jgi:hypothetical protein
MRRLTESLLLAAILLAGCLVAACEQSGGGAIASFSPSRSASISLPSRSASVTPVGAENLCHQVIFVQDAASTVTPLHPEMIQVVCRARTRARV